MPPVELTAEVNGCAIPELHADGGAVAQTFLRFGGHHPRPHPADPAARWLVAVGDDRVLACVKLLWEGRGSGITLAGEIYYCYWLRHGRFFRVEDHLTLSGALHALGLQGETLEAVGLPEQDA